MKNQEGIVNEALLEAFRHNGWATKQLIASCRGLADERLTAPGIGSFGGILATFNHLVLADGGYLRRLAGSAPAWVVERDENADLEQLGARVEELQPLWERFLSQPVDTERVLILDEGAYQAKASVLVTQVLNHGNVHREQICAILTGFGIEPPDIDAWAHGEATARGGPRSADD